MVQNNDWKEKYQNAIQDLNNQELDWKSLESILLRAITRLCIAGRGFDQTLDKQLVNIQTQSKQKLDKNLAEALVIVADIIASLTEDNATPAGSASQSDALKLMQELLQAIRFSSDQADILKTICSDLQKSVAHTGDQEIIKGHIGKLANLINDNFDSKQSNALVATKFRDFFSQLNLDNANRADVDQALENSTTFVNDELQSLADIINSNILTQESKDTSINHIMTLLLERLSIVQGPGEAMRALQAKISDGIEGHQWPATLEQIVSSISLAIKKINDEKRELENFIKSVTQQLGQITNIVTEDHEDHLSSHNDSLDLQVLMQKKVQLIKSNVDTASDINQLKVDVSKNIELIRLGIDDFLLRANERHLSIEARNQLLSKKISQMEEETQELQINFNANRQKLLFDTLTGVHSRLAYDEQIEQELTRWQRYKTVFSYAILDIDHFKRINDEYGHNAGDNALKFIAQAMKKNLRKSDFIFRIGGEEFVLLLINTGVEKAEGLVNNLRASISASSFHFKQQRVEINLSAGITEVTQNDSVESLYERADQALYLAKNSGRNCQFTG